MHGPLNIAAICDAAERSRPAFTALTAESDYETKGILHSEMLFLVAACSLVSINRILESGRARGQSTRILVLAFPRSRIISVEFDSQSPDCAIAQQRLQTFSNLELLFGDSRVVMPRLLERGDIVLIDGPKHFRALRLAIDLLRTGKPSLVFIHDLHRGCPERRFVERKFPECVYSDDPEFVTRFGALDEKCWAGDHSRAEGEWKPFGFGNGGQNSYGPTLACIPGNVRRWWPALFVSVAFSQWKSKVSSSH